MLFSYYHLLPPFFAKEMGLMRAYFPFFKLLLFLMRASIFDARRYENKNNFSHEKFIGLMFTDFD